MLHGLAFVITSICDLSELQALVSHSTLFYQWRIQDSVNFHFILHGINPESFWANIQNHRGFVPFLIDT